MKIERKIHMEVPDEDTLQNVPIARAPVVLPPMRTPGETVVQPYFTPSPVPQGQPPQAGGGRAGDVVTSGGRAQEMRDGDEPYYALIDEGDDQYMTALQRAQQQRAAQRAAANRQQQQQPKQTMPKFNATKDAPSTVWGYITSVRDKIPFSPSGSTQSVDVDLKKRTGMIAMRLTVTATNPTLNPITFRPWNLFRRINNTVKVGEKDIHHWDVEDGITLALAAANVMQTRYPEHRDLLIQDGVSEETILATTTFTNSWWMWVPGPYKEGKAKLTFETYSLTDLGFTNITVDLDVFMIDGRLGRGRTPLKYVGFKKTSASTIGVDKIRSATLYRPEGSQVWNSDLKVNVNGKESLGASHIAAFGALYPASGCTGITGVTDLIHTAFPGEKSVTAEIAVNNVAPDDLYIGAVGDIDEEVPLRTAFEQYDIALIDPNTGELIGIIPQE